MSTILSVLESHIRKTPNKIAIWDANGTFTYQEMWDFAHCVAANLQLKGVKIGDSVTIELPRGKEYIASVFGVLLARAVAVPLALPYPEERKSFIYNDCAVRQSITPTFIKNLDRHATYKYEEICDDDVCFYYYTSGSTGNPKGVIHNHKGVYAAFLRTQKIGKLNEHARIGYVASFTFIVFISEIVRSVCAGVSLYIVPDEYCKDPVKLAQFYADYDIDSALITPKLLSIFKQKKKTLSVVLTGSEQVRNMYSPDFQIYNLYGSTETIVTVTTFLVDKSYVNTPIGQPYGEEKVYLLDENNNLSDEGEICVAGHFALGYLNREEETQKAFIKNPFKEQDGFDMMFRTGDIGRRLEDGNILYVDRKDWMVKINGQRVEPQEVEVAICNVEGVEQAAVKAFTLENGQNYLCAYYVSSSNVTATEIRNYLNAHVTSYMIPAFMIKVDALPRNENGKINRKALVPPSLNDYKTNYEAPENDMERLLCDEFEKILQCGKIGRNDDFILLGGDSIKAMHLQQNCNVPTLTTAMIVEYKTPKCIAQAIAESKNDVVQYTHEERQSYPLTASQLGVYFPSIQDPQSVMYNIPSAITFAKEDVDCQKLITAIEQTLKNHQAFRCHVDMMNGIPSMIPFEGQPKVLYKQLSEVDFEKEKSQFVRPFNLKIDWLCRAEVYETEENLHILLDFHHIIFDGTSLSILLDEIRQCYAGLPLSSEQVSLFDVATTEEKIIESDLYHAAKQYFTDTFSSIEASNDIPLDYSDNGCNEASQIVFTLSEHASPEIVAQVVRQFHVTEHTFFLSAFAYTLSLFNGSKQAFVCIAENGRHSADLRNTIGMLVKTIALPFDFSDCQDVTTLLQRTDTQFKESVKYDCYPFSSLANEFNLTNDVMFVYQSDQFVTMQLDAVAARVEMFPETNAISRISMHIFKTTSGFEVRLSYRKDLFDEGVMKSFAKTFEQIVSECIRKTQLKDFEFVTPENLVELDSYNQTESAYEETDFVSIFRKIAKQYAEKDAVVCKDTRISYAQLDDTSERIARFLVDAGVKPDDVVGILIPRCEYMAIATIGVLKSGAGYQPLDASYPSERLTFMVHDADAKVLITTKELASLVENYEGKILYLEDIDSLPATEPVSVDIKPNNLFVILYTSGTTGTPKGVMLEHCNMVAFAHQQRKLIEITADSRFAEYASYGFDAFISDFIGAMANGCTLYIIHEEIRLNIVAIDEYCTKNRITHLLMTTQVARQFIEYSNCSSLKYVMMGGETLVPIDSHDKTYRCVNAYGPSETTIFVTTYAFDHLHYRVPIGNANANTKLYVVDSQLRRLPVGVLGELLIAGKQVGRGYLNRPEKNASSFIQNPFCDDEGYQKIYRSGDVVRMMPNGIIDFIGRNDGQVKIRGFRIELPEVEGIIRQFSGIKDATVRAFDSPQGGKFIAAYIVSDQKINLDDLRAFIASEKPPYMVPESIMQIDAIPLNQNQKVNVRALPKPERQTKVSHTNTTTNVNTILSTKIREIISQIINTEEYSNVDNLFDFGLNSLSVVRLSVLLNQEFGVNFDIQDILGTCSVLQIENIILSQLLDRKPQESISKAKELDRYQLTQSQIGIYVECAKDTNSVKYNIPMIRLFKKEDYPTLTVDVLVQTIESVFDAHNVLKCTIDSDEEGTICMFPHPERKVKIDIVKTDYQEFKKTFVRPIDLGKEMYHLAIVENNDCLYLFSDIHHILFDGSSQTIFMNDFVKKLSGEPLDTELYTMFSYATDEIEKRQSKSYEQSKTYFSNLLSCVDGSTVIEQNNFGIEQKPQSFERVFSKLSYDEVEQFNSQQGITQNVYFLSVMSILLARYTYQNDVCFCTVYNGRKNTNTQSLVGMLVKTLPVVGRMIPHISVKDFLANMKNQILDTMSHDVYSFAEISKEFDINMDMVFIYQGKMLQNDDNVECLELHDLKAPIEMEIFTDGNRYTLHISYDEAKYSRELMEGFVHSFEVVAQRLMNEEYVSTISLIDSELQQQLDTFNDTEMDYDTSCVVYRFKKQVELHPDTLCVHFHDESYTWKQVDELSDKIASYAQSLGIGRNDVISVLIPRGVYMSIATIGILKAGAGYQPLDSSYPTERLNFMVKDACAKLVITTPELRPLISEYNGTILYLQDVPNLPSGEVILQSQPQDLFCMLYTSGTTGVPKGVMLENRNIACMVANQCQVLHITEDKILGSFASYGFDACMSDISISFSMGVPLHIIDEDTRLNMPALNQFLIDNKITHIIMTTQVARQLVVSCTSPYLECVECGGEKLVPVDMSGKTLNFFNAYGPTECTVGVSAFLIDKFYERIPIGKINPNCKAYIVDKDKNVLPAGALGELCVAGDQVGRGYLNRPDNTAFERNPFSQEERYNKIYHTGDVIRILPDGNLDFIGRNDGQVKIRGFRIELTEIEEVIRRFHDIDDVTVTAIDDPNGGKCLVAYVVSAHEVGVQALNLFIANEKPPYMVPKFTMQIDKIPLNVNSKVDKRKLPKPDASSVQKNYVAPTNALEKEFCDLFASILGLDRVGITDDFFLIGGTSLSAAKVVSYAYSKGYDVVYKNVFENSSAKQLAAFVASQTDEPVQSVEPVLDFSQTVEPVFSNNIVEKIEKTELQSLGDVLLFGATGFLGIHILKEFLETQDGKITCVIRNSNTISGEERLKTLLEYYFETTYQEEFGRRIFVINGDITDKNLLHLVHDVPFDTILNSAACVKHFAQDDSIEQVNTNGVKNLISIANALHKKLIQISTTSIAGESVNNSIPDGFRMTESMLYFGQNLDNKYAKSKFEAEKAVAHAIEQGLSAKIIRVGNLMSRSTDGEFQINQQTNNFINTLKALKLLQCVPFEMLTQQLEFSPIDKVAKAIVILARTPEQYTVFHANNSQMIQMNNVVDVFANQGFIINKVSRQEFLQTLDNVIREGKYAEQINPLMAYRSNKNEIRRVIETDNAFTLNVLYQHNFSWPIIDSQYLRNLIQQLIEI